MSKRMWAAWLVGAALLAPAAQSLSAQVMPVANVSKPTADAARVSFQKAFFEAQNVGVDRAVVEIRKALAADPNYGMAQVYEAVLAPGLSARDRELKISAGMGSLGDASAAEVLLATWWRENAAGRGATALPVIRAAAELAPGNAEINYTYDNAQRAGKSPAEQAAILKAFVQKFPNHAAAWNNLAYTLWRTGDRDGSLAAVEKYVALAPNHPNSHDSYADILLLLGRGQDALGHAQHMQQLDPQWSSDSKLGAIALTLGDVNGARTHFEKIVSQATDPEERILGAYWLATTDLVARTPMAAVQQLTRIAAVAKQADLLGQEALAFDRLAVVDAYVGNRGNVTDRLANAQAAAATDAQKAAHQALTAVALSRIGKAEEAQAAATRYGTMQPNNVFVPALDALLALDRKDYAAAEAALAKAAPMDVLPRALRAELLIKTGRRAEGEALRKELMNASLKQDGNPGIEFTAVIGRMRLASL